MRPEVLVMDGVVSTEIDEVANRLRVGVVDSRHEPAVRAKLRQLRVPNKVVIVEQQGPVRFASSLRDAHSPLVGGLQIASTLKICTLGFVANRSGVRGIVTNSHCTERQGGNQGTLFGQPDVPAYVAQETVDPELFRGNGCPSGFECRYSDAAFAEVLGLAVDSALGRIAKANLGSPAWNGTRLRIRAEGNPLNGQRLEKIGRTTGRTRGTVSNTCVDFRVVEITRDIIMLCQAVAGFRVEPGDSGSPAVAPEFGTSNDRTLKGIVWGRVVGTGDGVFSPLRNVQMFGTELGPLRTCAPGFSC